MLFSSFPAVLLFRQTLVSPKTLDRLLKKQTQQPQQQPQQNQPKLEVTAKENANNVIPQEGEEEEEEEKEGGRGGLSNTQLLLQWGFASDVNPFDTVMLNIGLPPASSSSSSASKQQQQEDEEEEEMEFRATLPVCHFVFFVSFLLFLFEWGGGVPLCVFWTGFLLSLSLCVSSCVLFVSVVCGYLVVLLLLDGDVWCCVVLYCVFSCVSVMILKCV